MRASRPATTRDMATPTFPASGNCGNCNKDVLNVDAVDIGERRHAANRGREKRSRFCASPTSPRASAARKALDRVSFTVMPGEVHGLLGKNGSGKSTLVKILAGFHAPETGGSLEFNGEHVELPLKPGDFRRLGMSFVHQNLGLAPSLTVLENLRFAHLTTVKTAYINWRAERSQAIEALARFGLTIDPQRAGRSTFSRRAGASRHRARF